MFIMKGWGWRKVVFRAWRDFVILFPNFSVSEDEEII